MSKKTPVKPIFLKHRAAKVETDSNCDWTVTGQWLQQRRYISTILCSNAHHRMTGVVTFSVSIDLIWIFVV